MAMEKRHHSRLAVDLDTEVVYRRRSFQARIENISLDGMLLATQVLRAPIGTLIKIGLHINGREWQVAGLVVHQVRNRIGVMLQMPQPELYRQAAEIPLGLERRPPTVASYHG